MMRATYVAAALLLVTTSLTVAQHTDTKQSDSPEVLLKAAINRELVGGEVEAVIKDYLAIATRFRTGHRPVAAKALLQLARTYEKLASAESRKIYDEILRDFADQTAVVAEARQKLASAAEAETAVRSTGILQQQIWASRFVEGGPSPDGRYLPWVNWPGGRNSGSANLALYDLKTGQDRDVTHAAVGEGFAERPHFTPDGQQLVYTWYDFKTDEFSLRAIHVDGSNERILLKQTVIAGPVSPDGRSAAVIATQNDARQIAIANLSAGTVAALKSVEWRDPQLGNFSPDGRFLVYSLRTSQESQDRDVYVIAADASSESRIVAAPGENRTPFFTPDGERIVFVSNRSGRWDLWSARVSHGKPSASPEILKADIGSVNGMGFSRGGTYFYRQQLDQHDAYDVDIDPRTMLAVGAPRRLSDRFVHSSAAPTWSADGRALAYVAWRGQSSITEGGDKIVVVRDLASGRERDMVVPMQRLGASSLRWFPDRKSLLFAEIGSGRRVFRRLDVETGGVETVMDTPYSNVLNTTIAPDGRSFLFTMADLDKRSVKQVLTYDLQTREQKPIYQSVQPGANGTVAFHGFSTSRDGRRMAFLKSFTGVDRSVNWSVMLADLAGGEPREIWRSSDKFVFPNQATWDAESAGLFVVVADHFHAAEKEIWWVPIDGAQPHPVGVAMPQVTLTGMHPDGRRLGFSGGTSTTQVWTLSNLSSAGRVAK